MPFTRRAICRSRWCGWRSAGRRGPGIIRRAGRSTGRGKGGVEAAQSGQFEQPIQLLRVPLMANSENRFSKRSNENLLQLWRGRDGLNDEDIDPLRTEIGRAHV